MFRLSTEIKELADALSKAQAEFPDIPKDKKVTVLTKAGKEYSYMYAELSSIIKATRPMLTKNGLSFNQAVKEDEKGFVCVTRLMHSSGQWMENDTPMIQKENDMQGMAAALTFSRRYGLTIMIGIAAEEDTDGDGANRDAGAAKKQQQDRRPPSPSIEKKDPPKPPMTPTPVFFEPPKTPLTAFEKMELGKHVFLGGKFKGKKLSEVSQNDIMSYRNDIYAEFPEGGPNPMPRAAQDILNRINAFYFDQIK